MIRFEFINKHDGDERSIFANMVCQLLIDKYDKDIIQALKFLKPIYEEFHIHVDNIYELIDTEIPLFSLYDLLRLGKDNWGFTEEEFLDKKQTALKACVSYYRISLISVLEWEKDNL